MKSKLTHEQIAEINRICIERFGKSPTSLFRCWCNDVVLKLISATDKVVFNAVLSHEFATPDCDEWRKKHEISLHDIEDELLLANSESIQPLNEIKVKWLKEWFADHTDIGGDIYLTIAVKMMESADTPQRCCDAITFIHSKRNYMARFIKDNPGIVDNIKEVYNQMKSIVADCGGFRGRCEGMVEEFGRTVFPDEYQPLPHTQVAEGANADTSKPDFSHMESFTPTIEFDALALYLFLKDREVINHVDEEMFCNCIGHAHMNTLWESGKRNQLRCVIRHLKEHYKPEWINIVAKNLGKEKKKITNPNRETLGNFEKELRDLI